VLVGLWLPGPAWLAIAWLSPAAAAVAVTLALGMAIGVTRAAVMVGAAWSFSALSMARVHDPLALVGPMAQATCLVLVLVSVTWFVIKYNSLELPGRAS
jgi:hypothetical protein